MPDTADRASRPSSEDQSHAERARALALEVLDANRWRGWAKLPAVEFDYTCPSRETYPFQFNWDSCFHAIALSTTDPARAQAELSSLLLAKQPSGFLPHMLLWPEDIRPRAAAEFTIVVAASGWHTVTTNPPVLPLAVERVWLSGRDDRWLDSVIPDVVDVMTWWRTRRDPGGSGLVSIIQPDESGLDSSSKYDGLLRIPGASGSKTAARWHAAMRELFALYEDTDGSRDPDRDLTGLGHFAWQDVLVNSIYACSSRALARLLRLRGNDTMANEWETVASNTTAALLRDCWDPGAGAFYDTYRDVDAPGGVGTARGLTITSLFPLILEDLPHDVAAALVEHLTNEDEFWLPYPIPSVAATEPSFDPAFGTTALFRGPSWVNLNWYIHLGLRTHGFDGVADELARRTKKMVATSGLRECYNPYNAAGYGARGFGWSGLVLDLP